MKSPPKQGPTAEETALNQVSTATWNDLVGRYRPAEAALAKKAELTAGERAQVKGEASADTAATFAGLTRNTIVSGAQAGARVNSGKTKLNLADDALAAGRVRGLAVGAAETGAELDASGQQLKIAGFGRNIATEATANLSRGAHRATSLALAASQARFERNQNIVNAGATVAGAATRKYGDPFGDKQRKRDAAIDKEFATSGIFTQGELF